MKELTLKKIVCNLLEIVAGTCFVACTILVLINVFLRYFMNTGLYWSEEVCTSLFVWGVYIGAAACYKRQMHLGVDVLVKKLPKMIQKIVTIIVDILLIVLNAYITFESYVYISLSYTKPTPVLNMSSAFISVSLVISFACMTAFSLMFLVQDIRGTRKEKA